MKAVTVHEFGGPEVLHVEDISKPAPGPNEILLEVHASSLNPVDAKSIRPDSDYKSKVEFPMTPGMDVAGVVSGVGKGVKNIQIGDKVYGQASALKNGSGAFAEYAVTSQDDIASMPSNISFVEAAALPLTAASAYQALHEHIQLERDQRILIHGGSGGIGSFAIQLAKHIGAHVITTATGAGVDFVKSIGADEVVDYKNQRFEEVVGEVDAVLDTVGGDTYERSFQVIKKGGIIVSMLVQPNESLMKEHNVRAVLEMTKVNRKILSEISELIDEGVLRVQIAKTFPLEQTADAYRAKDEEKIIGKIAIEVRQ